MSQSIYYSQKDLESITKLVKEEEFKKIYITGDMGAGKSHFCAEFKKYNGCEFIELDKERRKNTEKSRNDILAEIIKEKKDDFYILEHYQLLDGKDGQNTLTIWEKEADILILLNPKRENIQNGADYDTGPIQKANFDKLNGKIIYCNSTTGTYVKCMVSNSLDWQDRRFYLEIADEDYLGARALCLIGIYLPAGVLAQQAVEKYIKLKLIELRTTYREGSHDLLYLFQELKKQMGNTEIKDKSYYEDILVHLTNSFNWKYFDRKGLRGALNKNREVATGLGRGFLSKFDELCMQLRNTLSSYSSGGTPISLAINETKPWARNKNINLFWSFHTDNKFANLFVMSRPRRVSSTLKPISRKPSTA